MLNGPIRNVLDEQRKRRSAKKANVTEAVIAGALIALVLILYAVSLT